MTRAAAMLLGAAAAVACRDPGEPPRAQAGSAAARAAPPRDAPAPAVETRAPRVVVIPEPAIALPSQESFRVLDAGRPPRTALRYTLAAAPAVVATRTELASRHLEHGAFTEPAHLPALRDGFEVTAAAPGQIALRALAAETAADSPDAAAYLAGWRGELEGRRATLAFDPRGGFGAIAFADDPTGARSARARDELAERLLILIVPLPDAPVGVGARWRVVTILRHGPAVAKQTATYTLVARGAAAWKLRVAVLRVGEQQAIADPALPRGATAELIALFRSLDGQIEVDPRLPLIARGSLAVESRLHARVSPSGTDPGIDQMFEDTGRVSFARCALPDAAAGALSRLPQRCRDAHVR